MSWSAGLLGGLVGARDARQDPRSLSPAHSDRQVRAALLGRSRRQIARVLGAPPTASLGLGATVTGTRPVTYWQATTWYYPLDHMRRRAVAIRFEGDRARRVDLIGAPASNN